MKANQSLSNAIMAILSAHAAAAYADVPGKTREVTGVTAQSFQVTAQGGLIEVLKARLEDGKKVSGGELVQSGGVQAGSLLGS